MNPTSTPNPNPIPPALQEPPPLPPGSDPAEQIPVVGFGATLQALLREPRRVMFHLGQPDSLRLTLALFLTAAVSSLIYGLVAGTFSGGTQLWAAPVKVAAGLLLSGLICLPSLYIFACLGGSKAGLAEIAGLVAGLLALTSVLLIGFAPVAWVFSQSTESVNAMGALHIVFGLVAMGFGLRFLHHAFARVQAGSRAGLATWTILFLLVALQMTTALRPIVGKSQTFLPTEKRFFVGYWFDCLDSENPKPPTQKP